MSLLTPLRRLIIGRRAFILSHFEFKKIILTGQMAIVVFIVAAGYTIFDLVSGVYVAWPYQVSCGVFALFSFALNRSGRHTLAKIILVTVANLTVYVFAASENVHTQLDAFFIVIAIATIAGFGYEQKYLAIGFVVFTVGLYLAATFIEFNPIPGLMYDEEYARESKIINFISGLIASSLIVFALITVNFHSEKALRESGQLMATKNEELSRLNVELDRFVYSSSHDLTAPLRSILGLINLCNLTDDREESKKYLAMIKDRVTELQKFIKEMSDYSKNASSAVMLEEIEVKKLTREVLETLRFYPHAEKLIININIEDDLQVFTDHTRLKVILSNIISNSFKYCDLNKKEPFVRVAVEKHDTAFIIEISDNGIGINETSLPKIFDMFFRAHSHSDGTGLGLYIVKETIDKLGGTIAVHSSVGNGTTFKITLPTNLK